MADGPIQVTNLHLPTEWQPEGVLHADIKDLTLETDGPSASILSIVCTDGTYMTALVTDEGSWAARAGHVTEWAIQEHIDGTPEPSFRKVWTFLIDGLVEAVRATDERGTT